MTAVYGSDFSVAGYRDAEFESSFSWDTDLLSGYQCIFLSRVADGGPASDATVTTDGLRKVMAEVDPAAILLVGYSPRFHRSAFYHAWRFGRPILFRGETSDHARSRSRLKNWARKTALRWLYGKCSRLLYVGSRSREHFLKLGISEKKLIFSPYCVDTSRWQCGEDARESMRTSMHRQLKIGDSEIAILFSGKLSHRKGPDLLLAAVKSLGEDLRSRVNLVFLGAGELVETLGRSAHENREVRAHFVGFQNQSQLSPYYHAADILALPSRHSETWGLVVNEALHHGVPCVISDAVGCAPDLIEPGQTGEVAPADSVEGLAAAIGRALQLTGRADVRENCRARVAGYTVEKAAEGIARAFREVAV